MSDRIITFKWDGKVESEDGTATFYLEGVPLLSFKMELPNFSMASKIDQMFKLAYQKGKDTGIEKANSVVRIALNNLLNQ